MLHQRVRGDRARRSAHPSRPASTTRTSTAWTTSKRPRAEHPGRRILDPAVAYARRSTARRRMRDFELMLSGHTHGGQICLPGAIPITLECGLAAADGGGAWKYHDMAGYTSVGVGSSVVPVRLNCPPEITLHRLRCSLSLVCAEQSGQGPPLQRRADGSIRRSNACRCRQLLFVAQMRRGELWRRPHSNPKRQFPPWLVSLPRIRPD